MTGPWWEPEARELHDACERCGDEALVTLTADGELCGPCADELADPLRCWICGDDATGYVLPVGASAPFRVCDRDRARLTEAGLSALMSPRRMQDAIARLDLMRAAGIDPLLPYDRSGEQQRGAAE